MAGGAPQIKQFEAQTSMLEQNKAKALEGKGQLESAISALSSQRSDIKGKLNQLYKYLDNQQLPPQARGQIQEQIATLKNAENTIKNRISEYKNQLKRLKEQIETMGSAIVARKNALKELAGRMANQVYLNSNRESGNKKG